MILATICTSSEKSQQVTMYNRNYGGFDYPSTALRAG